MQRRPVLQVLKDVSLLAVNALLSLCGVRLDNVRDVLDQDLLPDRVFLQMLQRYVAVLRGDVHPQFHIVFRLVRKQRLGDDGVEEQLALHCEEIGEDGPSQLVLEEQVDVLGHEPLEEGH